MEQLKVRAWDKDNKQYLNNGEFNISFFEDDTPVLATKKGDILTDNRYVLELFSGLEDRNDKEIYKGDRVTYWHLYENHSNAVDMFGVEPQNNWDVHEVYPEQKTGVVEFENGCFVVDGIPLIELYKSISNQVFDLYCYDTLGMKIKDWIKEFEYQRPDGDKRTLSKITTDVEVIGHVHENELEVSNEN